MYDELDDFTWQEQAAYAEIICTSFTENEIEHLEIHAKYMWLCVEAGLEPDLETVLVLERLWSYED